MMNPMMAYPLFTFVTCLLIDQAVVGGTILHQIKSDIPSGRIPISEMRRSCGGEPLVTSQGQQPTNDGSALNIRLQLPSGYTDCSQNSASRTGNALTILSSRMARCYKDASCQHVSWHSRDMSYSCAGSSSLDGLYGEMKLEVKFYCEPPAGFPTTATTTAPTTATTTATTTTITTPTTTTTAATTATNNTPTTTRQKPDSPNNPSTMDLSTTNSEPLTVTSTSITTTAKSTSTIQNVKITPFIPRAKVGEVTNAEDMKYLKALIVVSVLLALVTVTLGIVVISFIRYRRKGYNMHRKFSTSTQKSRPPSRQALYSNVSEAVKLCEGEEARPTSHVSSVRYQPDNEMEHLKTTTDDDYAMPMEGDNYEDADEPVDDTYEMVDTNFLNKQQKLKAPTRTDSDKYSYGYMIPMKKKPLMPPTRNASEKYADGYLVPTTSKPR